MSLSILSPKINSDLLTGGLLPDILWLEKLIGLRVQNVREPVTASEINELMQQLPAIKEDSPYGSFIKQHKCNVYDRIAIALGVARAIAPRVLKEIILHFNNPDFHLVTGGNLDYRQQRFHPTIQTILFLAAGHLPEDQIALANYYHKKYRLFIDNILIVETPTETNNEINRETDHLDYTFRLSHPWLRYFLGGPSPRLDEETDFPAFLSTATMDYEDVVLPPPVRRTLDDVVKYMLNRDKLMALPGVAKKFRSSYVVIFSGFPGTGKTVTANAIGKKLNIPVYIVNQAKLVSKYIGDTEKNLEKLFDRFDNQDCILFFDEADAVFGKRIDVKDSKDRFANQEVAYLLQRIELFKGLIILATNVHDVEGTFDRAFQRRIRRHIHFPFPDYAERFSLWEKALPEAFTYEKDLVEELARYYQINGSSINNVISDTIIEAVSSETRVITFGLIEPFLRLDFKRRKIIFEKHPDEEIWKQPTLRYGQGMPSTTREFEGIDDKLKELKIKNQ